MVDFSVNRSKDPNNLSVGELWNKIGFHKTLAGFYFNLIFFFVDLVIGLLFAEIFINWLFPYPEIKGYETYTIGIFSLVFSFITFWVSGCWDQFIPAKRIQGTKYMMRYVQFFTWWGVFTGLIQMTVVAIYAFFIAPSTNLAYTETLMVIFVLSQIPQPWGLMGQLTGTLQHYNKTSVYGFIASEVYGRGVRYGCMILGRFYGIAHPEIGELMGLTIGMMVGDFLSPFLSNLFGMAFYRKVLLSEGVSLRDFFGHDITWPEIKEMLIFGIKRGGPGIINQIPSYSSFLVGLVYIPQITTLSNLSSNANSFAAYINQGPSIGTNVFSEAFMNGKKNLTQYYIRQSIRYSVFFQCLLIPLILIVNMILPTGIYYLNIPYYALIVVFVIPSIINDIPIPYSNLAYSVIGGTNHPLFSAIIGIIGSWLSLFFSLLWIVWLQLPAIYGLDALEWILPAGSVGTSVILLIVNMIFIQKRIIQIKIAKWQTFGVPIICSVVMFGYFVAIENYLFFPLIPIIGFLPAAFIFLFLAIEGFSIYFGLSALLGGWDKDQIDEFETAARMSGPSKCIVMPIFWITRACAKISKLHGRFSIPSDDAIHEALDLYAQKLEHK